LRKIAPILEAGFPEQYVTERLPSRSQIKQRYTGHHQQAQNDSRSDELDPFLIVREPSMMHVHGQPPSGYHAVEQHTLS
jgi:hypothetical protein